MLRLRIVAVGTRMPQWVQQGVAEYSARLPRELDFGIDEVKPVPRKGPTLAAVDEEGARVLARIERGAHLVLLDEGGSAWSTAQFAARIDDWQHSQRAVVLAIGGADGHAQAVRVAAAERFSLSALTMPHALVRVLVVEQIYRAIALLRGHPYHRA